MKNTLGVLKKNKAACLMLAVLAGIMLWGGSKVAGYGVSFDEPFMVQTMRITNEYAVQTIGQIIMGKKPADNVGFLEYHDRIYGVAVWLPLSHWISANIPSRDLYRILHIYMYLWFTVSVAALYKLLRSMGENIETAAASCIMYAFMPRIYAESAYNMKDVLFLSVLTVSIAVGFSLCRSYKRWKVILYAFLLALAVNLRFIGGISALLVMILYIIYGEKKNKAGRCIAISVLTFVILYAITPYLWTAPVKNMIDLVFSFGNYSEWDHTVWFCGRNVRADELPAYYLVLWIVMTVPLWVILPVVSGVVRGGADWIRKIRSGLYKTDIRGGFLTICVFMVFLILLADFVLRPVKYDGWRHFYFLYLFIVIIGSYGIRTIFSEKKKLIKKSVLTVLMITFIADAVWCVKNRLYEYVYFNPVARPFGEFFDSDNWLLSAGEAWKEVLVHEKGTPLIWSYGNTGWYVLSPEEQSRCIPAPNINAAEYAVVHDRIYHWLDMRPGEKGGKVIFGNEPGGQYSVWKEKYVDDQLIYQILKRE